MKHDACCLLLIRSTRLQRLHLQKLPGSFQCFSRCVWHHTDPLHPSDSRWWLRPSPGHVADHVSCMLSGSNPWISPQCPAVACCGLSWFVTQRVQPAIPRARWFSYLFATTFLRSLTTLYIFLLSDFSPVIDGVPYRQIHQCWVFHTSQVQQIAMLFLLTQVRITVHAGSSTQLLKKNPPLKQQITKPTESPPSPSPSHTYISHYMGPVPVVSGRAPPATCGKTCIPGSGHSLDLLPQQPSDSSRCMCSLSSHAASTGLGCSSSTQLLWVEV